MIKALFVNDDPDICSVISLALGMHPQFDVTVAGSALDALDTLQRDGAPFEVIVLDIVMPEMRGDALLAAIRQLPCCRSTSVVFLAPNNARNGASPYHAIGAQGVIAKPFDPVSLPDRILELLEPTAP